MTPLDRQFLRTAGRILNAGQSRSLVLSGCIHDLFRLESPSGTVQYVPLVPYIRANWDLSDRILLVYELNGPIRFQSPEDRERLAEAWLAWRTGKDADARAVEAMLDSGKTHAHFEALRKSFDANLASAVGNPTLALELLRQFCLCSRTEVGGKPALAQNLIILIEAADMVLPEGEIARLSDADRHRVAICQDWFCDPGFMDGGDSVVLIAESRSLLNRRLIALPQLLEVRANAPDEAEREAFIAWFSERLGADAPLRLWGSQVQLARATAGLSLHALMQMLRGASHEGRAITPGDAVAKVEDYIQSQLGEDMVEFKKSSHSLDDVVGFSTIKAFVRRELIPRFSTSGPEALAGAAVGGPVGGGKTFLFEAVAGELDMPVLVLKNLRSQWYGQTDVLFERLRSALEALGKVLIFVDEADTQFSPLGSETHGPERRLTGKIQAMMSDTRLRGRVIWLLMTARIHLLSPDVRRPGRVGDLIVPVLDPEGEDRDAFIRWTVRPALGVEPSEEQMERLRAAMPDYSAAGFASLRSELQAKSASGAVDIAEILEIARDRLPPAIASTRRYQTLQALVNCTRKSLLPSPESAESDRLAWQAEIRCLEAEGVR